MFKKLILFITLLSIGFMALAQELPPKSSTLVTDYTNTLSGEDKNLLESKLVAFDDSTSTQIAVVIIKSVGDNDINEYGQKLGRAWGIGSKGKNNGILILVAMEDRKVSIQTGYGAEGGVPDATTHEIIQNDITPRFKQGDYYGGLDAGTTDLMKYMKGEYKSDKKAQSDGGSAVGGIMALIFIVVFILIIIFRRRGGGGGGQIYGGRGGASPFWWFLGGALLGRGSGGWGGFSNGDGGFGGSSGGDSGGGFGGFGGGDFGGGGSSGSW